MKFTSPNGNRTNSDMSFQSDVVALLYVDLKFAMKYYLFKLYGTSKVQTLFILQECILYCVLCRTLLAEIVARTVAVAFQMRFMRIADIF